MESRKYQLKKQIIEALQANDSDSYSLLKSQWAHRFGVESLDELKNLDLNQSNQKLPNLNNLEVDQIQDESFEGDKTISKKEDNDQEIEIKKMVSESIKDENDKSFSITSYATTYKKNDENKAINSLKVNKRQPDVKALIPLPPKPKYSYLKKWLLRK